MSRITKKFEQAKKENRSLLIPYLTAGFPSIEASIEVFKMLAKEGADIIEIGIPFSDPLADGPTIQRASEIALEQGVTTKDVFNLIKRLREITDVPLVIMTYYNLFYRYGLDRFAEESEAVGLDGVIIPDLPPEEATDWLEAAKGKLDTIFLIAPTSSSERIRSIADHSEGFIYCVSLTGVTGARSSLPMELSGFIESIRKVTGKPLAVGFGISTPEQAKEVAAIADAVIIGSAFIKAISEKKDIAEQVENARKLLHQILPALRR